jgi:hypothetical protein
MALGALAGATLLAAPLGAQSPWSKVPAFPKGCFQQGDTFARDADKALEELTQATYRQEEANAAVKAKLDEIDAGTRQSRMMTFLQKDPANAAKYMQDMTAGAAKQQTAELKAVTEYLGAARLIFDLRLVEAWPGGLKPSGG